MQIPEIVIHLKQWLVSFGVDAVSLQCKGGVIQSSNSWLEQVVLNKTISVSRPSFTCWMIPGCQLTTYLRGDNGVEISKLLSSMIFIVLPSLENYSRALATVFPSATLACPGKPFAFSLPGGNEGRATYLTTTIPLNCPEILLRSSLLMTTSWFSPCSLPPTISFSFARNLRFEAYFTKTFLSSSGISHHKFNLSLTQVSSQNQSSQYANSLENSARIRSAGIPFESQISISRLHSCST